MSLIFLSEDGPNKGAWCQCYQTKPLLDQHHFNLQHEINLNCNYRERNVCASELPGTYLSSTFHLSVAVGVCHVHTERHLVQQMPANPDAFNYSKLKSGRSNKHRGIQRKGILPWVRYAEAELWTIRWSGMDTRLLH